MEKIDFNYYRNVAAVMLPQPQLKRPQVKGLKIISITVKDEWELIGE